MTRTTLSIVFGSLLALTGCGGDEVPTLQDSDLPRHIGERCTVQFRRDALGGGGRLPVSPTTASINGAEVMLRGKLVAVDATGITLAYDGPSPGIFYWIPAESILLVEFNKP